MFNALLEVLKYLLEEFLKFFGYEPFVDFGEPILFKAIFEAIKSIFLG